MPFPLWNVTYMFNRQISGQILKHDLVKVKKMERRWKEDGECSYKDILKFYVKRLVKDTVVMAGAYPLQTI